ncbi:TPA: hypothetical protein N0F65_007265 [Lagenidium giganteum]|uniref:Dolichyl-diphosphooligosaccharide--protein glycosyltransferase subunit 2 n=1 Tax=Lagenidium giganteum TaxID=4803 RepID=A0AAV2YXA6_9STRA|nr:TPA: hypothetical protein N0F65_007265 [Lagenidium giganteum]
MAGRKCACQFLPCICTYSTDEASFDAVPVTNVPVSTEGAAIASKKSKLRSLFAANAMTECTGCMFLPCICPGEDGADAFVQDSNGVHASPGGSEGCTTSKGLQDELDEDMDDVDALGRVPLPLPDGRSSDLRIPRELKRKLKPHQLEGVEFLYSNLRRNRGCILADYMGLGKTLQVVTVIYSAMVDRIEELQRQQPSNSSAKKDDVKTANAAPATTMVLCPAICIPNWESEFKKWLAPESLARCPLFTLDTSNTKGCTRSRIKMLQQWKQTGGVLLMGYEMYRSLLNPTATAGVDRDATIQVCTRVGTSTMQVTNAVLARTQKASREFFQLLCDPGADLVVLDEGHRMKDPTSLLCQSVAKIRTPRRLVLTGYPVQNSLSEYWCMVNFARENFLGSYDEFRAKFEKPIVEGNVECSKELIAALKDVVLRRGKTLLRQQLPPKKEWILYCKLSDVQHRLYCDFLDFYGDSEGKATADLLTAYAALLQVMNHPDIIHSKLFPQDSMDDSAEEGDGSSSRSDNGGWNWESEERLVEKREQAAELLRKRRQKAIDLQRSYEWARKFLTGVADDSTTRKRTKDKPVPSPDAYETQVLDHSGKMVMLMQIVKESLACGDKVVVFSQSVPTLKVIGEFLHASSFNPVPSSKAANEARKKRKLAEEASRAGRRRPALRPQRDPAGLLRKRRSLAEASKLSASGMTRMPGSTQEWFLQIDGNTSGSKRMEYIERFSSSDNRVKLLLVSTRAGAEGINLHAANRLVLFDVSWNPSNDHQSMCRSHRIGQSKVVHVYRLVSTGTMERMIYEQQMKKVDLSTNVVDQQHSRSQRDATSEQPEASSEPLGPYSGFLRPPSASDFKKRWERDPAFGEDPVLSSCLDNAGDWLVAAGAPRGSLGSERRSRTPSRPEAQALSSCRMRRHVMQALLGAVLVVACWTQAQAQSFSIALQSSKVVPTTTGDMQLQLLVTPPHAQIQALTLETLVDTNGKSLVSNLQIAGDGNKFKTQLPKLGTGLYKLKVTGMNNETNEAVSEVLALKVVIPVQVVSAEINGLKLKQGERIQNQHFSSGSGDALSIEVKLQNALDKSPVTAHQVFLRFTHQKEKTETYFVLTADSKNTHSTVLSFSSLSKKFSYKSGDHSLQLIVGDPAFEKSVVWDLGSVDLLLGAAPPPSPSPLYSKPLLHESDTTLKALPEIKHMMRPQDKRPPFVVSLAFSSGVLVPLAGFLAFILKLGVNVQKLFSGATFVFGVGFLASFAAILALFALYWLELTMYRTLAYLAVLGTVNVAFGHWTLKRLAQTNVDGKTKSKKE